jgi:CubicO group peptidase (beta-lactamase class C family)
MRLVTALGASLSLLSAAEGLVIARNDQPVCRQDKPYEVYYNVDAKTHSDKSRTLTQQGYRPVSLSLSGPSDSTAYAAVWAQQNGTAFQTIFDVDQKTYDAWVDEWRGKGYVSTHVAATGAAGSAVFAGVMEQFDAGRWFQECGLAAPWDMLNTTAGVPILSKGFQMYGEKGARQYCLLYHENFDNQLQTVFEASDSWVPDYERTVRAETAKRFWRSENLWVSDDGILVPTFANTAVGTWAALDGITEDELAAEITSHKADGRVPISLQAAGSGKDAKYSVIFAQTHIPRPRKWTTTGTISGFVDNAKAEAELDEIFRTWMKKNGVRQAQFAMAINGTEISSRGYTWAESDRAIVQPDDRFLLASVSKMFSYASISRLLDEGKLNLTTAVYPFLGYEHSDPRGANITVKNLLEHTGGDDREKRGDIAFMFRDVAYDMPTNGSVPATLRDVIEYMIKRPLDFTPEEFAYPAYSNYGTMVMSYLVENIPGVPYMDYLRDEILDGLDVRLYETAGEAHVNDNIVAESKLTGLNPVDPKSSDNVPAVYGGDGSIKEETAGAFSLAASASSIARFIGKHCESTYMHWMITSFILTSSVQLSRALAPGHTMAPVPARWRARGPSRTATRWTGPSTSTQGTLQELRKRSGMTWSTTRCRRSFTITLWSTSTALGIAIRVKGE